MLFFELQAHISMTNALDHTVVIILNCNDASDTINCINSIEKIVVVDNESEKSIDQNFK
jgi:hypothetical protein